MIELNLKFSKPLIPLDLSKVEYIVVHHTATKTASPQTVHQWHLNNGWAGIGYAEYISKNGIVYKGRGDNIGAHCHGYNSKSYGICCEGNYDVEKVMPVNQFNALADRIKFNRDRFTNLKEIVPHKRLSATSCPGQYFLMDEILNAVKGVGIDEAARILLQEGIITDMEYWLKRTSNDEFLKTIFIRMAERLKGEK
jgi:N-acetylmuramoyl-L-alanine amidase